ncbi:cobalamin B12-binding domain-containing protein [Clostridiales bacterium]|nr:cobalamin B12-binding domain-containing protein [Clostridiales bacterium]
MKKEDLIYIKSLRPELDTTGEELLRKGREIGKGLVVGRSRFCQERGYDNHMQYRMEMAKKGETVFILVVGRATLEEQLEAFQIIYDFCKRLDIDVPIVQNIPSPNLALPKELRENATKTTSYMINCFEEWKAHVDAAPLEICFCDAVLSSPNSLETTVNSVKCGSTKIGEFSQFIWRHQGFTDEYKRMCDFITSLGIVSTKRDDYLMVETYLDDGMPGYFMDCVSYIAYALLEHYICEDLCHARYTVSFGGLLTTIESRMGTAIAIHKLLARDDQCVISYINNSTNLAWDHDIEANYGIHAKECLIEGLVERKYHMGMAIDPVAITEKVAVTNLQEQLDVFISGKRVMENLEEWEKLIDLEPLDKLSDEMARLGKQMFENILEGFQEAGINIKDPLELVVVLQNFNRSKIEGMFHPSTYHTDHTEIKPLVPTAMGKQMIEMRDEIIADLQDEYQHALDGHKVLLASGDTHTYGLLLVDGVLTKMGATVVNAGVEIDPITLLDLADEEGITNVGVSVHNGQALDYGRQLSALAKERNKRYHFFMGGKMNTILPGHSDPSDVEDLLVEAGIHATNDLAQTIEGIKNANDVPAIL